jgi:hypothetical protein
MPRSSSSSRIWLITDVLRATQRSRKQHCPNDTVVWVNTKTGVYHLKGERWYRRTKEGAFVCRKEAEAEGDRMTKNGQ